MNIPQWQLEEELNLPPIAIHSEIPANTYRSSYSYGSMQLAANYCNISYKSWMLNFFWQHGCIPPWQNLHPTAVTYGIDKKELIYVARTDQVRYLKQHGFQKVKAIGIPICYVPEYKVSRRKASLLIMPPHVLASQKSGDQKAINNYIEYINSIKDNFHFVAACINKLCADRGYWLDEFRSINVGTIRGAHPLDKNALVRQRFLFQTFETMTSPTYGSHVPYALDAGCRVSISGPRILLKMDEILKDTTWKQIPEIAYKYLIEDDLGLKTIPELKAFQIEPENAKEGIEYGSFLVGRENKLNPSELRKNFRWKKTDLVSHYFNHLRNRFQIRSRLKNFIANN